MLLHLPGLMHPLVPGAGGLLYKAILICISGVFHRGAFAYSLLTTVLVFAQGLYLNGISDRRRLYLNNTYLPLFSYISVSALLTKSVLFSAPLLAIWPLLVALDIMLSFPQPQSPRANIFNAGFLLSVSALIFFPAAGFFFLFVIAMLLLRPLNAGEWIVGLLGYLTPIYFTAGILFLADNLHLFKSWPEIGISLPRQMKPFVYLSVGVGTVMVLLWSGLYALQGALGRYAISVRRGWGALIIALIIAMLAGIFTPQHEAGAWRLATPMIALVAALPVANEKRGVFCTFIFLLMLGAGVFGAFVSPH